jgi:hypothetical protein
MMSAGRARIPRTHAQRILFTLLITCRLAISAWAAQDAVPAAVNVFWKQNAIVRVPGVTRVMVLDESICQAEAVLGEIRLTGVMVGDTVVFVWVDGVRTPLVVHVAPKPEPPRRPVLSRTSQNALGHGRTGTSLMFAGSSSTTPLVTHEYWDWQQTRDGARLSVRGFTNTYTGVGHAFNVGSFLVEHKTTSHTLSLADFTLNMGADGVEASSLAQYGSFSVRGMDFTTRHGRNRVELFGGSTVPSFFLSFAGSRSIVGAKLDRMVNPGLRLFATAGVVDAPTGATAISARALMPFETSGVTYTPSRAFSVKATAGLSTRGLLGDVQADYVRGRFAGSVAGSDSSSSFPLNRVQLVAAGESSVRGMATLAWPLISVTTTARHSVSKSGGLTILQGTSNSLSESVNLSLPHRQQFSGTFSRSLASGTVLASSRITRLDGSWSSPLGKRMSNTLQSSAGRTTEPTQLHSYGEFTFRDSANLTLPFGGLSASFEHQRLDPSAPARIREVIDLLPAELRDLFRLDPVMFLQTVDLPADVRRLLQTVQPTSTSLSVGAQYGHERLSISPNFSILADTLNGTAERRSYTFGYAATWRLSDSWQLRSALSNRIFYTGSRLGFQRSNVMTLGLDKSLTGLPHWLAPLGDKASIDGHVFRDNSGDGEFGASEPGLPSVRVRLDDGRVVVTDKEGYFRFKKVKPGVRHLSLQLTEFPGPVRVTTPSEVDVEVVDHTVQVNFGIVNFARIIGTAFNDYHNDGNRQSDAPGLPRVRIKLTGSRSTVVTTDSSGDFEAADLQAGDYTVAVVTDDLPAGYLVDGLPRQVHVDSTATVVADLPVRALRSIAGRVLLKTGFEQDVRLEPVAGVTITAGGATATTDAEGRYALRDLPAGPVEIRVVPVRDVPDRLHAPVGIVRLRPEPTQVDNANVIISNPELMEYLTASYAVQPARKHPSR